MYLRTTQRRNRDGSVVHYLQLAHNQWDPLAGHAKAKVLFNFGRSDQLDRDAIKRLIVSLSRAVDPVQATGSPAHSFQLVDSRPLGGAWLLDQLWQQLGFPQILQGLLGGRRLDARAERVLFAMVCNRALNPLSKLGCAGWVGHDVVIPGLAELDDDACYRTMDWLLDVEAELAEQVYWALCDLLNLEVDLLFFDTTSTYFEIDEPDPPRDHAPKGFRSFNGHSKDHRPDLPQLKVMLATLDPLPLPLLSTVLPGCAADDSAVLSGNYN